MKFNPLFSLALCQWWKTEKQAEWVHNTILNWISNSGHGFIKKSHILYSNLEESSYN